MHASERARKTAQHGRVLAAAGGARGSRAKETRPGSTSGPRNKTHSTAAAERERTRWLHCQRHATTPPPNAPPPPLLPCPFGKTHNETSAETRHARGLRGGSPSRRRRRRRCYKSVRPVTTA
ncbi:hypothetical protein MTO96_002869 [Rhipicephalus appendiculatus]